MKKGCTIGMYLMYISFIFKLSLCIVYNVYVKSTIGIVYKRIIRRLDAEEMNSGLGMLETGRFQRHETGVLGVAKNTLARMWEWFQTHMEMADGTPMAARSIIEILDVYVPPYAGATGPDFILMADNAHPDWACVTNKYLQTATVERMD